VAIPLAAPIAPIRHALVIGAGLAGSSVAAELHAAGWRVQVLRSDRASAASDLPVGLMAPLVSRSDTPASQLVRLGQAVTLAWAHQLLREGKDFAVIGCRECNPPPTPLAPVNASPGQRQRRHQPLPLPATDAARLYSQAIPGADALWHPQAAWLRPRALADALLHHAGCEVITADVVGLRQIGQGSAPQWQALAADGHVCAQAPLVVVAAGVQSHALLASANAATVDQVARWRLARTPGQINWVAGPGPVGLRHALNGHGHFVPNVPVPVPVPVPPPPDVAPSAEFPGATPYSSAETATFFGATYRHDDTDDLPQVRAADTHANRLRAAELCASAGLTWQPLQPEPLGAWVGSRCTSPDRLPRVGAVGAHAPGLWVLTALGSRGLSLAPLAARSLAFQLIGNVDPIPPTIGSSIAASRGSL
jgi:tRNA 5-methylaminomethyl-2-thiouridine biosynthesis bifunctional protein